jgi:glycosyltransferase involved in cell wall biosynthesis/O-antigen ligase
VSDRIARHPEALLVALIGLYALDIQGRFAVVGGARMTVYQLGVAVSIGIFGWLVATKRERLGRTPLDAWAALLLVSAAAAIIPAFSRSTALVATLSLTSAVLLAYLVAWIAHTPDRLRIAILGFVAVAWVLAVFAVIERLGIYSIQAQHAYWMDQIRAQVTFEDTNRLGGFLAAAFAAAIPFAVTERRHSRAVVIWAAAATIGAGIVSTGSRGAMLGLVVGAVVAVVFAPMSRRTRAIVAVGLAAAALAGAFALGPDWLVQRVAGIAGDESVLNRLRIARAGLRMFADHPFGIGPGNYVIASDYYPEPGLPPGLRDSHITYVTLLAEEGILGFIGFVGALVAAVIAGVGSTARSLSERTRALAAAALAATAVLIVQSTTYSSESTKTLWMALGFCVAASSIAAAEVRAQRAGAGDAKRDGIDRVVMLLSNGLSSDPRVEKEASALVSAGWDVIVLAWDRSGDLPESEVRDGWRIERLGPVAIHGAGLRNIRRYRAFWAAAAARACALEPDVIHCHDMDTAPAGLRTRRDCTKRPRLVLDMHELYRESNMVPQAGPVGVLARAAVRLVEMRAFAVADAILVANPGTLGYYESRAGAGKVTAVENAPDPDRFRLAPGPRPERPFTVGFMGKKRYPDELVALVDAVGATEGTAALLAGGGTGADEVARYAASVPSVRVSGPFSYDGLPDLYMQCDCIYAVYDARLGNVRTLFPVKVMEAMACGLPVIVAEGTWAGNYVLEHGIGLVVRPSDVVALRGALGALKSDPAGVAEMGRRGRGIIEGGLNWPAAAGRLTDIYGRLAR